MAAVSEPLRLVTGPQGRPDVRIVVPAHAENVAVVRQALAGLGESLDIEPVVCDDMKVAVTEACTNAIVHGYGERPGWLEIAMGAQDDHVVISVRDGGRGFRPLAIDPDQMPVGYGLSLIANLTDRFELSSDAGGTTIEMSFSTGDPLGVPDPPRPLGHAESTDALTPIEVTVAHKALAAPVLGRVISVLAARADFSVDRLSDAQLVSDALAEHAPEHAADGVVRLEIGEHGDGFELAVGPLAQGGAEQLVSAAEIPGLGNVLRRLTDELETVASPEGPTGSELLRIALGAARG